MESIKNYKKIYLWALATTCFSLLSVKWMFPPAAWIAPALLILLMREFSLWKSLLWGISVLYVSSLIAGYNVMPFPTVIFIIIALISSLKQLIPFLLYRLVYKQINRWYLTVVFPCLYVTFEYLNGFDGGGTWGSLAYTQVNNSPLMQLTSVTGLWGITFIITWASSILAEWHFNKMSLGAVQRPLILFLVLFGIIFFAGTIRINPLWQQENTTVRVAGITGQNLELLQSTYEAVFGQRLDVELQRLTHSSPELQELNKGLIKFIENPLDSIFKATHLQMEVFQDSILNIVRKEADAGAKIVALSEGLLFCTKSTEHKIIEKAQKLSEEKKIYFLLSLASFIPGEVTMGSKYLENKALFIGPHGEIMNIFFKNMPVPLVEPSIEGDGLIPVIQTEYGRVAISICYDADFPYLMRQAGQKEADIVLLPSGDWREISPYHAYMAKVRAVENGFSLLRPVSGAVSIASDYHGIIKGRNEFRHSGENVLVSQLPTKGVCTVYALTGDLFAWACLLVVLAVLIYYITLKFNIIPK
jgi:apolipoprotein N-acyltransferase